MTLLGTSGVALFVASSVALSGISLVTGLVVLRWIPPETMGVWQLLLVVQSYLQMLRLGTLNGLNRELPYMLGRGDAASAKAVAGTALGFGLLSSAVVVAAFTAGLAALWPRGLPWRASLSAMATVTLLSFYVSYVQATCRSSGDFRRLALLQFGQAALLLGMPFAVSIWGFRGFVLYYVLHLAATAWWAHSVRPIRVRPGLDLTALKPLLGTGLPLFLTSSLFTLALGFDRIILYTRGGTASVGLYTPAAWVFSAMALAPGAFAAYVYPQLSYRFGQSRDPAALWQLTRSATWGSLAATFPFVLAGWVAIPWVVSTGFPEYMRAAFAMRLLLLAGWLLMGPLPGTAVLRSLRAWGPLAAYTGSLAGGRLLLPWYFSRTMDILGGVALGCLVSSAIAGAVGIWGSYYVTHRGSYDAAGTSDPAPPSTLTGEDHG